MRFLLILTIAFCGALWSGCSTTTSALAPPVTTAMIAAGGGALSGTLERGRELYTGACTSCHAADAVSKYTMVRWREIIGDMAERTELNAPDKSALLAYLTAATSMPQSSAMR
jgi:mono/diheme cytochrome c family protein